MQKLNQRECVLEVLDQHYWKRVDFRIFWYKWISEPGSRISELRSRDGMFIPNNFIINKETWQKQSYYALNPKFTLKESFEKWLVVKSNFDFR